MQPVARPEVWLITDSEQMITTPVQTRALNREQQNKKKIILKPLCFVWPAFINASYLLKLN